MGNIRMVRPASREKGKYSVYECTPLARNEIFTGSYDECLEWMVWHQPKEEKRVQRSFSSK